MEATADLALDQLVRAASTRVLYRAASTRVLYRAAPPPTGKAGAPRKDGDRFKGSDPSTHGEPAAQWTGLDAQGQEVTVRCWGGLHRKECRHVPITAVCLTRPAATNAKGDPRELWLWWLGGQPVPPLDEVARLYPRRFSIEHGYRFDKQDLLWAAPHVRTPEQMERWTDVVAAVHNEIGLARARAQRRPNGCPGRIRVVRSARARSVGSWPGLWPRRAPRRRRPARAENPPDAPWERSCAVPRAIRSSAKGPRGAPHGATPPKTR